jgi:hypothetical protein
MRNHKACLVLIAMLLAPIPAIQAQDRKPSAQEIEQLVQQRTAELRKSQAAEKAYIEKLNADVRGMPTNQKGATEQQQKLRESVSKANPALQRSLNRVNCRDRTCALDFKLSQGASGEARARDLFAIDEWAAWSQSCAYTMVHDLAGSGGTVQVFIDCAP